MTLQSGSVTQHEKERYKMENSPSVGQDTLELSQSPGDRVTGRPSTPGPEQSAVSQGTPMHCAGGGAGTGVPGPAGGPALRSE